MAAFYRLAFTQQATLTIPAAVHQLGTPDLLYQLYTPAGEAFEAGTVHVDPSTWVVTVDFGDPLSGTLLLWPVRTPAPMIPMPSVPAAPVVPGAMPAMLRRMLVETVLQAPYVGQDHYGKPTYGPQVARPARVEYKITTLPTSGGSQRTSTTRVFLDGVQPITVRDQLTLPDSTSPAIQDVARVLEPFAPARIHHYEVFL